MVEEKEAKQEESKKEEVKVLPEEEKPVSEPKNEDLNEDVSPIEEARAIQAENKKILAAITLERKRIEKAVAEGLMNGKSFAGQNQKTETADEKWAKEAKVRYAGTGMDPTG